MISEKQTGGYIMAYTGTLSAGGPGNFVTPNTAHSADGVEVKFITIDYINTMAAEITHQHEVRRRLQVLTYQWKQSRTKELTS